MNIRRDQISIMNIQYKYFPFTKFLDDAVKYGVKYVEVWGAAPHFHLKDMTYTDVSRVRREIEGRGLKVSCLTPEQCVYPINLAAETVYERRRSQKFFEDYIRAACEIGADKVLVTSGWGYFDGSNCCDAWNYAKEAIYELAECAKFHGVTIALEVLRKDESNLVNDLNSLKRMLSELNHENVGGMIDTCPMNLAGETPADYLRELGEKLVHVHFIDGAPRGHLAWGDGILDMKKYLEEFSEGNYQGILSLEITDGRYITDPERSVKQSIEKLFSVIS